MKLSLSIRTPFENIWVNTYYTACVWYYYTNILVNAYNFLTMDAANSARMIANEAEW